MKNILFPLIGILATLSLNAQDPGFRPAEPSRSRQAAAPTASGPVNAGAAVLSSMDVLDNNQTISTGDLISIRILEDRRDALQQRVAETGEVNAPYVGLVGAKGKTCRQLAFAIKKELEKNFFKNATVVVAIDQFDPQRMKDIREYELEFYVVFGIVARQGKYDLPSNEDITISQAILRAGGFAQFANKKNVKIVRKTPNQGNKTILVNVEGIMQGGDLDKDIYLRKDDVIIVDELKVNF
ncbi:MAG: polysaccharide biosynthesis/export family protein [Prosthecobacter sp.]